MLHVHICRQFGHAVAHSAPYCLKPCCAVVCPCVSSTAGCALSSILAPLSADPLFYEAGRGPAHGCRPRLLLPHFLFHELLFPFSTSLPPVWGCLLCCCLLLPLGSHSLLLGSCLFCLSLFSKPCFTVGHEFCRIFIFMQVLGFPMACFPLSIGPWLQWSVGVCSSKCLGTSFSFPCEVS